MNRSKQENANLSPTHERSRAFSDQVHSVSDKATGREIRGFPWQLVLVMTAIALGILTVILKGAGVL